MKKKIISCIIVGLLASLVPATAFAGTWERSYGGNTWRYLKDNGKYAREEWLYYNGSWYFFHADGNMAYDGVISSENNKTGGYDYYVYPSGAMASGGFINADFHGYSVFVDKDGHVANGLFMVDGVLYNADNRLLSNIYTYKRSIWVDQSNGEHFFVKVLYDKGKVLDMDGKPFASDSELYTKIKYLPKYDSKGNLIGEIRN